MLSQPIPSHTNTDVVGNSISHRKSKQHTNNGDMSDEVSSAQLGRYYLIRDNAGHVGNGGGSSSATSASNNGEQAGPSTAYNEVNTGRRLSRNRLADSLNLNDMQTRDRVQKVRVEPERTGWARLYDLIQHYDHERFGDAKEDIDTLLVFAGLFSAVVTAFIIESYKTLQQQSEDTTNQILLRISDQLASLAVSETRINSSVSSLADPPFQSSTSSIVVNTLWLLSLVFALITASLGILIKQWFHEYLAHETQDPRWRVKICFFRDMGIRRWRVFELASFLPLLLQLALLLFFIGLGVFLHGLNQIVCWIVSGVTSVWLMAVLFTTFAPVFSAQCPYKTPILKKA